MLISTIPTPAAKYFFQLTVLLKLNWHNINNDKIIINIFNTDKNMTYINIIEITIINWLDQVNSPGLLYNLGHTFLLSKLHKNISFSFLNHCSLMFKATSMFKILIHLIKKLFKLNIFKKFLHLYLNKINFSKRKIAQTHCA